eukprot:GHVU01169663.1.p2 GENE.GHVU01169663.1~~GHVU01169663.1.p2  ORF type:complete len:170 (+),score=14.69 GHVU01169663.1:1104-1613(+)
MTLKNGDATGGGSIVTQNCVRSLDEADGRSMWSLEGNSQLRLRGNQGNYCLSQRGSAAGASNLIHEHKPSAKISSLSAGHDASKALDGDITTYWASSAFDSPDYHVVNFDMDFGKAILMNRIRIDWEYQHSDETAASTPWDGERCCQICLRHPRRQRLGEPAGVDSPKL